MLLLATLLAAVLVTFSAQPAQAHTPAVQPSCSSLAVSATSYGAVDNHVTVVVDGETVVDQRFGQSFQRTIEWSQSVDHSWSVTIDQGDGDQFDLHRSGTQVACQPTTTTTVTTEPSVQDVCGPEFELAVPADGTGYRFSRDESGVVDGAGAIVVTATLEPGYVWQGGGTEPRVWTFDVTNEPCTVEVELPAAATAQDLCGVDYGVTVPQDTEAYAYSIDRSGVVEGAGTVVVTATLEPGFTWVGGSTQPQTWSFDVTSEPCTTGDIAAPTFREICGPDGEAPYDIPAATEHVRYVVTDPGTYVDGERLVEVVAELDEGYVAPEGAVTSWTSTFREESCDTPAVGMATAEVVVTGATCSAPGTAATGETERASWTVTDVPAAGGQATFVAVAEEGAAFAAGLPGVSQDLATRTFVVDVPAAGGELCSIAPPPVQPPTQVTPPVTPPQSAAPTLPRTGFDVSSILVLGALLAMAGSALVVRRVRADA
jgi:LPXTG-motif cell wall-anchored protein